MSEDIPSGDELQQVYDLIIATCEHDPEWHAKGAAALRIINRQVNAANAMSEALEEIVKLTHNRNDLTSRQVNKIAFSTLARVYVAAAVEAKEV